MTSVNSTSGYSIDPSQIKRLDTSNLTIVKLPPEIAGQMKSLTSGDRMPARTAWPAFDLSSTNDPANIYATIKDGDKTIATVYKNGAVKMPGSTLQQVKDLPTIKGDTSLTGLDFVQKCAEEIAGATGGTLELNQSATAEATAEFAAARATPNTLINAQTAFEAQLFS